LGRLLDCHIDFVDIFWAGRLFCIGKRLEIHLYDDMGKYWGAVQGGNWDGLERGASHGESWSLKKWLGGKRQQGLCQKAFKFTKEEKEKEEE